MKKLNKDDLIMIVQWGLFILLAITSIIGRCYIFIPLRPYGFILIAIGFVLIMVSNIAHGSVNKLKLSAYPQPNSNAMLITKGIYSYIRHPIYSGFIFFSCGTALLVGNFLSISVAILSLGFYYFKSSYEEKKLIEAYSDYIEYRKGTGRFLPHLKRLFQNMNKVN